MITPKGFSLDQGPPGVVMPGFMNSGRGRNLHLFRIQFTKSLPEIFVIDYSPNHLRLTNRPARRIWSTERVILRGWIDPISNMKYECHACTSTLSLLDKGGARLPLYSVRLTNVQSTRLLRFAQASPAIYSHI